MTLRVRNIPTSYEDAEKLLKKNGSRKISKNGWLVMAPEQVMERCIILKLYRTSIVTYYPNGSMKLDCGQFPTSTSQHWLNTALWNRGIITRNSYGLHWSHSNGYARYLPVIINKNNEIVE